MPSAHALAALAAVAQALKTLVKGMPESPTMPTMASGLATVQLPPVANWTSRHSTPASATAAKMASTPISIADLPSNRPNGCSPTPMMATSFTRLPFCSPIWFARLRSSCLVLEFPLLECHFAGSRGSGDGAGVLEFLDAVPLHAEFHQDDLG